MLNIVEGWTSRIKYTLNVDDLPLNLTGSSVSLVAYDSSNVLLTLKGTAGILVAASGTVYFDPAKSDMRSEHSPYSIRWKVVDATGKIVFFPNVLPETWIVRKP